MIILVEFATYILLSLGIAQLSVLAKDSISVVLIACALSYAWLWWPKNKIQLVAQPEGLQIYRLCVGVALGYFGAHFWTGVDPAWFKGTFFECAAFFFFLSGLPEATPLTPLVRATKSKVKKLLKVKTKAKTKTPKVKPAGFGLGSRLFILLAVLGLVMEYSFFRQNLKWGLIFMGAVVAVTVWLKLVKKDAPAESGVAYENYIFWALVGLAFVMRFPFIWTHLTGFQIDEANDMQGSADFLRNAVRTPFATGWSGRATFPFAVFSDVFKIFGAYLWPARGLSVIFAVLAVGFFYKLSRYFFGVVASTIGTLMFTVSWWCMWGSYIVIPMMMQDLGVILAFYFLEKALREGRRSYFWWSGTMSAITVMTYVWGRTAPLLMLSWMVVAFIFTEDADKFRKTRLWGFVAWAAGFLWILGPFIGWCMTNQEFFGRIKELSMMSLVAKTHDYMLPVKTFFYTSLSPFMAFNNIDERFALADRPFFDRVASLLFLIGIVLAFMALRKRSSWILLLGVASCLPANALAIQNSTPEPTYVNGLRFFCILPFVYWGVTYALEGGWGWIRQEGRAFQKTAVVIFGIVLAGTLYWNAKWAYFDFPNTGHWSRLGFNHLLIADQVRDYSKTRDIYLCAEYAGSSVVQFLDSDITINPAEDNMRLPLKVKPTRDVVFILRAWNFAEPLKDDIMKKCPHAVLKTTNDREGDPYLWDIEVPKEDLQ